MIDRPDESYEGRLIRHIRMIERPGYGLLYVEELYHPGEKIVIDYGANVETRVSICPVWRWRLVFSGDLSSCRVWFDTWQTRMRTHVDAPTIAGKDELTIDAFGR